MTNVPYLMKQVTVALKYGFKKEHGSVLRFIRPSKIPAVLKQPHIHPKVTSICG